MTSERHHAFGGERDGHATGRTKLILAQLYTTGLHVLSFVTHAFLGLIGVLGACGLHAQGAALAAVSVFVGTALLILLSAHPYELATAAGPNGEIANGPGWRSKRFVASVAAHVGVWAASVYFIAVCLGVTHPAAVGLLTLLAVALAVLSLPAAGVSAHAIRRWFARLVVVLVLVVFGLLVGHVWTLSQAARPVSASLLVLALIFLFVLLWVTVRARRDLSDWVAEISRGTEIVVLRMGAPVLFAVFIMAIFVAYSENFAVMAKANAGGVGFDFLDSFNEVVAGIYALLVAFLVFKALQDFQSMRQTLREEAEIVRALYIYSNCPIDEGSRRENPEVFARNLRAVDAIRSRLVAYVTTLLTPGALRDATHESGNKDNIQKAMFAAMDIEGVDENDTVAIQQIFVLLNNLFAARSKRIVLLSEPLSPFLFLLLSVLSFMLVFPYVASGNLGAGVLDVSLGAVMADPMALLSEEVRGTVVVIFLLSYILSFLFVFLLDMSTPFDGFWRLRLTPFEELKAELDAGTLNRDGARDWART